MKKYKNKLIVTVVLIALLAFAFWYGGDAPGARGWEAGMSETKNEAIITSAEAVTEA